MAGANGAKAPPSRQAAKPAPVAANDAGELSLQQLAKAILARELRPRTADVRRLAEAALAGKTKKKKDKPGGKKSKKLAKIPGQKKK